VITQSETGLYADVAVMALIFSWWNVLYENFLAVGETENAVRGSDASAARSKR